MDKLTSRLEKIEERLIKYEENQKSTDEKVTQVASQTTTSSTSVKMSILSEIQEQENRKTNLVIYSLNESDADEGQDRKASDLTEIGSLLQHIKLPESVKDDIAVIRRLGKRR